VKRAYYGLYVGKNGSIGQIAQRFGFTRKCGKKAHFRCAARLKNVDHQTPSTGFYPRLEDPKA
jgi:hypothetical protein